MKRFWFLAIAFFTDISEYINIVRKNGAIFKFFPQFVETSSSKLRNRSTTI